MCGSVAPTVSAMQAIPLGFYDLLLQHRAGHPDKTAVVTGDQRLSYAELVERIDRLTTVLREHAVGNGDRVLWLGQNAHQVLELLVACARIGAMICPANWRLSAEELQFLVADLEPRLVVSQAPGEPSHGHRRWITVEGEGGYEDLIRSATPSLPDELDTGATRGLLVLYTAAFSGRPAGAVLTEQGLYLQGVAHIPVLEVDHDDSNLVTTPLFHIMAWISLLPVLIAGGTNIFVPRPDAETICRAIANDGATTGLIMPASAAQIAELNADGRYDLSGFRSGLPLPGGRVKTAIGTLASGYGQTETTGPILFGLPGVVLGEPSRGRPSPVARVRIVDESGRDVPVGETGEILVSGPTVTVGYWQRPDLNSERRTGRWWRTRDLGRRDPGGVITFIGPKLRMIKTGGENVYPAEVEGCLEMHPCVASAALIGCPDETWGQLVTAVVVRRPQSVVDADTLTAHVREKLAAYKVPRTIHFIDEMPMAATGKDYTALDAHFGGGNYPGTS
jgi:acyl-CoA synthetase (AMP-forming)/AMP-acid ligase II